MLLNQYPLNPKKSKDGPVMRQREGLAPFLTQRLTIKTVGFVEQGGIKAIYSKMETDIDYHLLILQDAPRAARHFFLTDPGGYMVSSRVRARGSPVMAFHFQLFGERQLPS